MGSTSYLHKLGARAVRYEPDAYSTSSEEGIYRGLPADRLLVRWNPRSSWKPPILDPSILETRVSDGVWPPLFALPVPYAIHILKAENMAEARRVRLQTRIIFQTALGRGYEILDFVSRPPPREDNCYIFRKVTA